MSVLSFPRIYFKGYMEWDPCTVNNNDWQAFPTYDPPMSRLWGVPGVPRATAGRHYSGDLHKHVRPWAITLQDDTNPGGDPTSPRFQRSSAQSIARHGRSNGI